MEMMPGFWRDKRVFVTGHTGFKGGWLSLWLETLGAYVTGYSLKPPSVPSLYEEARVAEKMLSVEGDIRDLDRLTKVMRESSPDIVIHMAAQPLVRQSYAFPVETYTTNVVGTVNLLEAVRSTPSIRAVVNVTSDKCYENREWDWGYRESDRLGGYDPYSNSKACAELVTAAYSSSYFNSSDYSNHRVAVATARAGNVIGGGDWAQDRLLTDIIKSLSAGEAVRLRHPSAVRPWQHVLEPLRGYLMLAQRLFTDGQRFGGAWNFGPFERDCRPVSWLVDEMARRWGANAAWQLESGSGPHEATHLRLDTSKAASRLGWHPVWDLESALCAVVAWHRARELGNDMRQVTLEQIAAYSSSIRLESE